MAAEQRARAVGNARITQVGGDHITYAAGAGPAPPAALGIPEGPAVLVGRDGALEELVALLAEGGPTVAVVTGLAGVGKSALAVATAHRAVELGWFGDRVFFLPLRGYAPDGGLSGPQAVQEMLRLLGVRDADMPGSPEAWAALYRARLAGFARAGQRVLVVADDAGSVAQIRDLVPAGPAHRLLVTSRHRLVAPGFAARLVGLEELEAAPAVELLSAALSDDPRPSREPEALTEVAERCGRLPLALTVAGALLAGDPGLPVRELASRLAVGLEALTFDYGGEVPVGVRAAFDLSYARLPAGQARLLRLLTVNPGPDCSTAHAELLAGAQDLRPQLAALVRASLLTEQPVGSGRWRMHDLVRLYARERGEENAREDGREGVIDAFLTRLRHDTAEGRAALGLDGRPVAGQGVPSAAEALGRLEAERAVAVAAVGFAADTGRVGEALMLSIDLCAYLKLYGNRQDELVVTRKVAQAARRAGSPEFLAVALSNYGSALTDQQQPAEAVEQLTEALALFRAFPFREGEGLALTELGAAYAGMQRLQEARDANERALRIFRELGNLHSQGPPLARLGEIHYKTGNLDAAVDAFRQAVALMRRTGDRHREATWSGSLATALWEAGQRQESLAVRERALETLRQLGHRTKVAWTLTGLASSLLDAGEPQEAFVRMEEAYTLFRDAGDPRAASALSDLGLLHLKAGRVREGLESAQRARALLADAGEPDDQARAAQRTAIGLSLLGRTGEAVEAFERAAERFREAGLPQDAAECRELAAALREEASPPGPRRPGRRGRK
ncbi:tetratricopeptide repeat protein [Streptomyces sp. NPDC048352]|uniref:tetratricopeptide repeat protein n=1 Tax=Streptomyces sp. NPDC048352 TaxID=3154718 RepID=UPI003444586A